MVYRGIRSYKLTKRVIALLKRYGIKTICYKCNVNIKLDEIATRAGLKLYHKKCFSELRI